MGEALGAASRLQHPRGMNDVTESPPSTRRVDEAVAPYAEDPEARKWLEAHLPDLRRGVREGRIRGQAMTLGFALGLASHIGGYLLRTSTTAEPFGLIADLLYALGLATWTGVVLVLMVDVIPRAKERQITRWLDAYEAALRDTKRL